MNPRPPELEHVARLRRAHRMSEAIDLRKEKNFFETRVSEYPYYDVLQRLIAA